MIFLFISTSCEKSDLINSNTKITTRSHCVDDCTDCPVDDCCCSITATSGGAVALTFCGVTDPCLSSIPCSATAGTCTISGYELYGGINFGGVQTELFCVRKGSAFSIQPTSGSGTARMTCQLGQTNPQTVNITWNSPNKVYYSVDNSCVLTSCL